MTDAPKRTLSERIRWENCICGKGMQDGDGWDLDTQCAYCDDADEVAALEQERDGYKDARDKWYVLAHADEVNRLRKAIREAIVEIDEARDYVEGTDIARSTLARALTEGDEHERWAKLDEEREEQERYRRDTEGENNE